VVSVDVMRGLTVAAMILVNDPGDPGEVYPQLRHAAWNGYTAADLVFPNFLFLAGVSLAFSLAGKVTRAKASGRGRLELARGLGRRSLNLILLKLALASLPRLRLRRMHSRIRIYGVLARTALCSLAAGLVLLFTLDVASLLMIAGALLAGYWHVMRWLPVPGIGWPVRDVPLLDPDNNLAAWLDRKIVGFLQRHLHAGGLYNITHDPEGLLSTAPAVATTLIGTCAGLVLRGAGSGYRKAAMLAVSGVASLAAGNAWGRRFPVNKNLWTSSFVLVSAGWSLLGLAGLYWLLDASSVRTRAALLQKLLQPAEVFGANALVAYAVADAGHTFSRYMHVREGGHSVSLRTWTYRHLFACQRSTPLRSLAFAVAYALACLMPNLWLWKRKIFVKL
jgi:predicted acyltransferase